LRQLVAEVEAVDRYQVAVTLTRPDIGLRCPAST
jgi:hypothetical protein